MIFKNKFFLLCLCIVVVAAVVLGTIGILQLVRKKSPADTIDNTQELNLTLRSEFSFSNTKSIKTWLSSDDRILEVKDGKLLPKTCGTVTVTGFKRNGTSVSCIVHVYPLLVKRNPDGNYAVYGSESDPGNTVKETVVDENGKAYTVDRVVVPESVYIPSTIEKIPVTEISAFAFSHYTRIKSFTIESGILSIGSAAFATCTSLESIEIPDSVVSMADNVFLRNTSLRTIVLPRSLKSIDTGCFSGCSSLSVINYKGSQEEWLAVSLPSDFPEDVTIVYNYAN